MLDQMRDSIARAHASPESSSVEPSMYESPSPPSSASSSGYAEYGSVRHRRCVKTKDAFEQLAIPSTDRRADNLRDISPIKPSSRTSAHSDVPYSDMPDDTRPVQAADNLDDAVWQSSTYVPVLPDETTALIPTNDGDDDSLSAGEQVLPDTRTDLAQPRLATMRQPNRREQPASAQDRYILGCSLLMMTSVVLMILVSGVATMLAHRNVLPLQVSSDWPNGGYIPLKYGCHAEDGNPISFPLSWKNAPKQATNLVILFANPGAIKQYKFDPIHWFITDIPLNGNSEGFLPANASANAQLMPPQAKVRANSREENAYWPPCAVNGTSFFVMHVYAIEAPAILLENIEDAREVMNRFVGVPVARFTGLYGKPVKSKKHDREVELDDAIETEP